MSNHILQGVKSNKKTPIRCNKKINMCLSSAFNCTGWCVLGVKEPGSIAKHHSTGVGDLGSEAPPGCPILIPLICHSSFCFLMLLHQPVGYKQIFPWFFLNKIILVVQHKAQPLHYTARVGTRSTGYTTDEKVSWKHNLWVWNIISDQPGLSDQWDSVELS